MMQRQTFLLTLMVALSFCSQGLWAKPRIPRPQLASINIVDRNGFSETISSPDRLKQFERMNFAQSSPYQKVLRVFKKNTQGEARSIITSYYPNGQIKQYLEAVNGRANGDYREWYSNGVQKLNANVIGGAADIDDGSEVSWLFEGPTQAFDEEGRILAEIPYFKGELEGVSKYYHKNGALWKLVPYHKNFADGTAQIFFPNGGLLQKTEFYQGVEHGESHRYWKPGTIAAYETYDKGKLISGQYYDLSSRKISQVIRGNGRKAIFARDYIMEYHDYKNGVLDGSVSTYNKQGKLIRQYHAKNGKKEGVESYYYESIPDVQPKLAIEWRDDKIHGPVKTWYPSGQQESVREISNNLKNGLSTAWYIDGSLMLIEEYKKDRLFKGEYFKKGNTKPDAVVKEGGGTAQIFDAEGDFLYTITYENGRPVMDLED